MKKTILIVDDVKINRTILKRMLQDDFFIVEAIDGQETINYLMNHKETISLVLLDLNMPVLNGFDVLEIIHNDAELSKIPILITTGDTEITTEAKALTLGASDYITKPYNEVIIKKRIHNIISLKESSNTINILQHDKLTGLYNREGFFEKARLLIDSQEPGYYIISSFDIENFKLINDQHGNDVGDEVLKHIANCISIITNTNGIACRVTADKFAIIYSHFIISEDELSENHQLATNPKVLDHPISIKIGRYKITDKSLSISSMLDRATLAESSVHKTYDTYIGYYDEEMRKRLIEEQEINNTMDQALVNKEFEVWFQPQYNHSTKALIGAEALARWRKPGKGLIQPNIFIPVFEKNGFIYELDKYIWEATCIFLKNRIDNGTNPLPISVNISRYDLYKKDFFDIITGLIKKYSLPINLLKLEITESAFSNSPDKMIAIVKDLINYGFTIEIDDFGSGYSSLNVLKDVPATVLKLDMKFLGESGDLQRGGNILESVVRMARWLGMSIIAEGVEKIEQADYLKSIGCNYIQGYLYSKPIPLDDYLLLESNSDKEDYIQKLQTVKNLNNSSFWNPESMDTLIFNSYIGGACIFEYHDKTIEMLRVNDKYFQVIGSASLSISDILNMNIINYVDKNEVALLFNIINKCIDNNSENTIEYRLNNIPGCPNVIYIRSTFRVIAYSGNHYLFYCMNENITAQREAEKKEKQAADQLKIIMNNISGGVVATIIKNNDLNILFANNTFYAQSGYNEEEYKIANKANKILHPDDFERVIKGANKINKTRKTESIIYRIICKDKSIKWIESKISIINIPNISEPVQLAVTTDITLQKEASDIEKNYSDQIKAILDGVECGITATIIDENNIDFLISNNRYYEIIGYTKEECEEKKINVISLIHSEDRSYVFSSALEAYRDNKPRKLEYRIIRKDGTIRWIKAILSTTHFHGNDQNIQLSIFTDITSEKIIEQEIKETDEQLLFLNNIAHKLLAQPDTEISINDVLHNLLSYFTADRIYIFEFNYEKSITSNTYEACSEGITAEIDNLKEVNISLMSFWINSFVSKNYISIEDIDLLDESRQEEKEILQAQNIKSLIAVPIKRDGKIIGFIGADNPKNHQSNVNRLNAIGDYLAVMLTRRDLNNKIIEDNKSLNNIMTDIPGGFVRMKLMDNGTIVPIYFNQGFSNLVNMPIPKLFELYQNSSYAGVHPDDIEIVNTAVKNLLEKGEGYSEKYRLQNGINNYTWVMFFGRTSKDESSNTILNVFYIDATKQYEAEMLQKRLLDNLPCGAALYEYDGKYLKIIHLNKQYMSFVDRQIYDYKKLSVIDFIHPNDLDIIKNELNLAIKENRKMDCEVRILYGQGPEYRAFHTTGNITKHNNFYTIYATYDLLDDESISYQKMLSVALTAVMQSSNDLSFVKDANLNYICCSKSYADYFGLEPKDFVGKSDVDFIPSDMVEKYIEMDSSVIKTGQPIINYEEVLPNKNGGFNSMTTSEYPLFDTKNNVIGIYCVIQDMTKEKDNFERLQLLTDTIPGGLASYEKTKDGFNLIYYNEGFYSFTGYSKEEIETLSKKDPLFLIYDDDKHILNDLIQNNAMNYIPSCTFRCISKNKKIRWFSMQGTVIHKSIDVKTYNLVFLDVTSIKQAEENMRISEEKFKIAASIGNRFIANYDIRNKIYFNDNDLLFQQGFGKVIRNAPQVFYDKKIIHPDSINDFDDFYKLICAGEPHAKVTALFKMPNDSYRWFKIEATTIYDDDHNPTEAILVYTDATEEREKEALYTKWQQTFNGRDPNSFTLFRCNLSSNSSFEMKEGNLLNIEFSENANATFNDRTNEYVDKCVFPEDKKYYSETLNTDYLIANFYQGIHTNVINYREIISDSKVRWLRRTTEVLEYPYSTDILVYILYENIDKEKQMEMERRALAENDSLTGILNRGTFVSLMDEIIHNSSKDKQHILMMIDIDGFKIINDVFGHTTGDKLLIDVANTLHSILRPDDLLCRFGGDEFMLLLTNIPNESIAAKRAKQICTLLRKSLSVEIQISASIGIVVCPKDGIEFNDLYKKVDSALYYVKGSGKDNYAFYHDNMNDEHINSIIDINNTSTTEIKRRMLIVDDNEIDSKILNNIFENDYLIDKTSDGKTALIRLRHYMGAFSIVLLDLKMPGIDGFKVLEEMQKSTELRNIPVIIVSSENDSETCLKAIRLGASDFIFKPVDPVLIKRRVASAISHTENERLRIRNTTLELQSDEVAKYKTIIEHQNICIIEFDCLKNIFTYDNFVSSYLLGKWDKRSLWDILQKDVVGSAEDIQKIYNALNMVMNNPKVLSNDVIVKLRNPANIEHEFTISIYKVINEYQITNKIVMVFNDNSITNK